MHATIHFNRICLLAGLLHLGGVWGYSQVSPSDCLGAIVICSDDDIQFNPTTADNDDFANPNNDPGCLLTGENRTVWYYFAFRQDMPPGSVIEFTLTPSGGAGDDYDFAIYGPDLRCDSLGKPVRCSFAREIGPDNDPNNPDPNPTTGLGNGAMEFSEPAYDPVTGGFVDGFVAPMVVNPGEGFYLLIDHWYGPIGSFNLSWGGSAAPYLNCLATPQCENFLLDAGPDIQVCDADDPIFLQATAANALSQLSWIWTDTAGLTQYMNNPARRNPRLDLPQGFTGTFQLSVTATFGVCEKTDSLRLTVGVNPLPYPGGFIGLCEGEDIEIDAGPGFQSYRWSTNDTTRVIRPSVTGTFSVTVTDAAGCLGAASVDVAYVNNPVPDLPAQLAFCPGDSAVLQPGLFNNYLWSDGSTDAELPVSDAGAYSVTVTNQYGCQGIDTVDVSIFPPVLPRIQGANAICPGDTTTLRVDRPYAAYSWTDISSRETLEVFASGTYGVTVTDDNGCQGEASFVLGAFPQPQVEISGAVAICPGDTAVLTATAGFEQYLWSNGVRDPSLSAGEAGDYFLTATDANGCEATAAFTLGLLDVPVLSLPGQPYFCSGEQVTLQAGPGFDTYLWSNNNGTGPSLVVDEAGLYQLTATASNGCSRQAAVYVREQALPEPPISGPLDFCEGATTQLSTSGPWTEITWSNGEKDFDAVFDVPGAITLTVTDTLGCQGTANAVLSVLPLPAPVITGDLALCPGDTARLDAGPGYVSYQWPGNGQGQQLDTDQPGRYQVTVTDANGCSGEAEAIIVPLEAPLAFITGDTILCEGETGTLQVTAGFDYLWADQSTNPELTVNAEGTYSVTVTNTAGCAVSLAVEVAHAPIPTAKPGNDQVLDCKEGEVVLGTATSGQDPFAFFWEGPGITPDNARLPNPTVNLPGTYRLIITDLETGCASAPASVIVSDNRYEPIIVVAATDTLDCITPHVRLDASGSDAGPGFVYQLVNATGTVLSESADLFFEVAAPGQYIFRSIDTSSGCVAEKEVAVEGNFILPSVEIAPAALLTCFRNEITLETTAPAGSDYTYLWTSPDGNLVSDQQLPEVRIDEPGTYLLNITDRQNGCSNVLSMIIGADRNLPPVDAGPDQQLDCLERVASLQASGEPGLIYEWISPSGAVSTAAVFQATDPGTYTLRVTDPGNGCANTDQVEVLPVKEEITDLHLDIRDERCAGENNGAILVREVIGGTPPFLYRLGEAGFSADLDFSGLPPGTYAVMVQDALGCEWKSNATIQPGNSLSLDLGPEMQIIKYGEKIRLRPQVSVPWTAVDSLFISTETGEWTCTGPDCISWEVKPVQQTTFEGFVIDDNGCRASDQLTVLVISPRSLYIPNAFSPNNDGANDRFILFSGNDVLKINSMKIMDRWGGMLFEDRDFLTNDWNRGWDGSVKGRPAGVGVYVYIVEVEFADGKTKMFSGDVTLVR